MDNKPATTLTSVNILRPCWSGNTSPEVRWRDWP
jgi:hypothetical protein